MMTKSEIAVLTVTMIGTLTAWLGGPPASSIVPVFDEPGIACSVPAASRNLERFGWAPYVVHQNTDPTSQPLFWRRG